MKIIEPLFFLLYSAEKHPSYHLILVWEKYSVERFWVTLKCIRNATRSYMKRFRNSQFACTADVLQFRAMNAIRNGLGENERELWRIEYRCECECECFIVGTYAIADVGAAVTITVDFMCVCKKKRKNKCTTHFTDIVYLFIAY